MPEQPTNQDVRYEKTDARVGGVIGFAVVLLLLGALIHLGTAWLFDFFRDYAERRNSPLPPLAARERLRPPHDVGKIPPPVLQHNEVGDLQRLEERDNRHLNSYGWVSTKSGVVRLPISEAMHLLTN